MIFPAQTPAIHKPFLAYNLPTKTSTRGSEEIGLFLSALRLSGVAPTPADNSHPLSSTWVRLDGLYDLEENWNGYEVAAPDPDAIEHARKWIQSLYLDTKNENRHWITPHVTANEDGNAVFEWSKGKKRLVIYVSPEDAIYIKAWGTSVINEMADGEAMSYQARLSLWSWLLEQ